MTETASLPEAPEAPEVPRSELRRAAAVGGVALIALNIADVVLTRLVLAQGGVELNPVADWLLANNAALVVKLAIVAVLWARFARRGPELVTVCLLWLVAGVYACVVVVNGSVYFSG